MIFFSPHYGIQWGPSTVWLLTFFKISSFVFSRRNEYRYETTWWCVHFWVKFWVPITL